MGRFQLELIYHFTYFSTVVPSNMCVFLSCRPFVVNTTFSTGLVGVEVSSVSWLGQLKILQHPQDLFKRFYKERPTGKHANVGWDDDEKIGKMIN